VYYKNVDIIIINLLQVKPYNQSFKKIHIILHKKKNKFIILIQLKV